MDKVAKKHYRTVVVSDIHLGHKQAKVREVIDFLNSISFDLIILNGDIFDGWQLSRSGKRWHEEYTDFLKLVMKLIENPETKVIYIVGNHDSFLDNVVPFSFTNFSVMREYIVESGSHRFFVTHGDVFDYISYNVQWLAKLGELGYRLLVTINQLYNKYRNWRNKSPKSFSKKIKRKVEKAVSSARINEMMADVAKAHKCDGIICGHTHQPVDKMIGTIRSINCGDWMESMSAALEDENGNWTLQWYNAPQIVVTQ